MITEDNDVFVDGEVQCCEGRFMVIGRGRFDEEETNIC